MEGGYYEYSTNYRPQESNHRYEETRRNSHSSLTGHGQQGGRSPYHADYPIMAEQDRQRGASSRHSRSSLMGQGQHEMDLPHYSNYPHDNEHDRRQMGSLPNTQRSFATRGQHELEVQRYANYPRAIEQDDYQQGRQRASSRGMMNHSHQGAGVPYHYDGAEQDRRQASSRRSSDNWNSQGQLLRHGGGYHSSNQLGYAQEHPNGATSGMSGGSQRQMMPQEPSTESISEELKEEYKSILSRQGFSAGLSKALMENIQSFHHRIWVVDNSGSMQIGDGHRVNNGKVLPVTRWEEIQDTVLYHSQMAGLLGSYTRFRLLNSPPNTVGTDEFTVGEQGASVHTEINNARMVMARAKPDGVTPLTQHIRNIQAEIKHILPELSRSGKRVAVILATDGLPTDEQGYGGAAITNAFIQALNGLVGLPVWLVIRLCTDESDVTDFYNQLDGKLEMSLEVLDDFIGEYKEVRKYNPWLNYALPLHRCRELGYHDRIFDLIDERALTKGELRDFCVLLFGTEYRLIPDPVVDWKGFLGYVQKHLGDEQTQWNPLNAKKEPWINIRKLHRIYGGGTCSIM